ncbi:MAG: site-specific integrase [Pseudomonadota bacterium]
MLNPLFDSLAYFVNPNRYPVKMPSHLISDLKLDESIAERDFEYASRFLWEYSGRKSTYEAYRKEIERLLLWCWTIEGIDLLSLKRDHIRSFIRFCEKPPKNWIDKSNYPRFINKQGTRLPNPKWRPFTRWRFEIERIPGPNNTFTENKIRVLDVEKNLDNDSVQALFAIISSLFSFLDQEEISEGQNPIRALRQKSQFMSKPQKMEPRRLSNLEKDYLYKAAKQMADNDPNQHSRTLFMIILMVEMYMRISELVERYRYEDGQKILEWRPEMGDIKRDPHGNWFLTTLGKGRKERDIAVPDRVMSALKTFRETLGLTALPAANESTPLIPALKTSQEPNLSAALQQTGQIREAFHNCSKLAIELMQADGYKTEDYVSLSGSSPHWLRHTGISEAVKVRPREHVRDDAGHGSSETTDRYINSDKQERAASANFKN